MQEKIDAFGVQFPQEIQEVCRPPRAFYARAPRRAEQKPFLRNRFRKAESSRGRRINRAAYHLQHLRIR